MRCERCGHNQADPKEVNLQIDLLPCPCCGCKAEFDDYNASTGEWLVRCTGCDLNTVPASKAATAEQWNRRVPQNSAMGVSK